MNIQIKTYKVILASLVLLLWVSNYWICEYFYSSSKNEWWALNLSIYNICIIISLLITSWETTGYYKILIEFITGLIIASVIDRVFSSTKTYTLSDLTMIFINITYALYNIIKIKKKCLTKLTKNC